MSEGRGKVTDDTVVRFQALEINRAEILAFDARLGARVIIELARAVPGDREARIFQLQFNRVLSCLANFSGDPWPAVITRHCASPDSSSPRIVGAGQLTATIPSRRAYRFVVELGSDRIDVVAEDFCMLLIEEVPHAREERTR